MDYPHHRPGEVQLRWLRAQLAAAFWILSRRRGTQAAPLEPSHALLLEEALSRNAAFAALERRQAALLIDPYRCERLRSMLL